MKIKINKIFGKYDNEIDLDRKINVFIGENGIGKSTTIKIIDKLFKFDYIGLLDFYFDSIDIIDDNEKVTIEYSDLMLTNEALIRNFLGEEYLLYKKVKEEFETQKKKKLFHDAEKIANRHIDVNDFVSWMLREVNDDLDTDLVNSNLDFEYWYDYDLFLNNIDNILLYKILKIDKNLLINEPLFKKNKRSLEHINKIRETYSEYRKIKLYSDEEYFNNTKYSLMSEKVNKVIKKIDFNDVLFIDMVSHFTIINDFNRLEATNDLEHSEVLSNIDIIDNLDVKFSFDESDYLEEPQYIVPLEPHIEKYKDIEYCNQLKENYVITYNANYADDLFIDIVNYVSKSGLNDEFINDFCQFLNTCDQLRNENIIDFGYLLYNHIYDYEKINEFKIDFYSCLNEIANTKLMKDYNISNETYNKIKCYLRPLLNSDNVIAKAFDKIFILNDSTRYLYKEELNFLGAFYNKFKNKYFDIDDEKLNLLNSLFKKYLVNKKVIATPFGISVSSKDYENDIKFKELSAGEKKIIILFMLLVFSKNQIILLDEPEASLSIVWQENLLKDIIINFDFNKIIVATQSPYIIESEDLDEYIIPLIDGDQNE